MKDKLKALYFSKRLGMLVAITVTVVGIHLTGLDDARGAPAQTVQTQTVQTAPDRP